MKKIKEQEGQEKQDNFVNSIETLTMMFGKNKPKRKRVFR